MTQFKYTVSTSSEIGNLGWNTNGSLASLSITDPFNSPDAQSCTYTHDDLARLQKANCGSTRGESYSYDPFGNIDTSVLSGSAGFTFQPTYTHGTTNTNQYFSLPGFTPTYDANGNLLTDSFHTYTWDAEGKMTSLDSTTLTYDALGRMVEQNQSGTYFQIVYSPRGKKLAIMKAQVIQQSFVPLPGKAKAEYLSWGLSHYRHPDWLGSSRLESSTTHGIIQSVAYDSFGVPYAQLSGGNGEISFTGQNKDTAWLQYDFLDRQYDPTQGRWISPDRLGVAAVDPSSPQSWNRYAYVQNNPLALVDPFGDFLNIYSGDDDSEPPSAGPSTNPLSPYLLAGQMVTTATYSPTGSGSSGGGSDPGPPRLARPVNCNTVLPDGSTIGDHIQSIVNSINNSVNLTSTPYGLPVQTGPNPGTIAGEVYSGTKFRAMYKGSGANAQFLGKAGNFAYGAVSADIGVPLSAAEFVAGVYAYVSGHPDRNGPYGMDNSATINVPAGYSAQCKK